MTLVRPETLNSLVGASVSLLAAVGGAVLIAVIHRGATNSAPRPTNQATAGRPPEVTAVSWL